MKRLIAVLLVAVPLLATEPNPSPKQRKLIEEYLELTNFRETQRQAMDAILAQFEKQTVEQGGGAEKTEEATELFTHFREYAGKIDFDGALLESTIRTYARYFSEKELADIVAFYRSPAGRKSVEVLPQLMREQMEAGAEHLGPQIDEAMRKAIEDVEKARPWQRTTQELRSMATAVEAYATDENRYPDTDYAGLKALLVPTYIRELPEKDIWGHAYVYVGSPDGTQYRFASAGSDGIFDWDSRRIAPATMDGQRAIRYSERLEDDVIFADGSFVQMPLQAKSEYD